MTALEKRVLDYCEKRYTKKDFEHAKRVYLYVQDGTWDCLSKCLGSLVALCHDLLEDTSCTIEDLSQLCADVTFIEAVKLLTKPKGEKYTSYCKRIKQESLMSDYGKIAWIVKLADMKDHLSQKETLTDRLKQKYLDGLVELL